MILLIFAHFGTLPSPKKYIYIYKGITSQSIHPIRTTAEDPRLGEALPEALLTWVGRRFGGFTGTAPLVGLEAARREGGSMHMQEIIQYT